MDRDPRSQSCIGGQLMVDRWLFDRCFITQRNCASAIAGGLALAQGSDRPRDRPSTDRSKQRETRSCALHPHMAGKHRHRLHPSATLRLHPTPPTMLLPEPAHPRGARAPASLLLLLTLCLVLAQAAQAFVHLPSPQCPHGRRIRSVDE